MSMQRWENWLHFGELLNRLSDPEVDNADWKASQDFLGHLPDVVLNDGRTINLADPAVAHFLSMIFDLDTLNDFNLSLNKMVKGILQTFNADYHAPGLHGYDSFDLDKLIAFREVPDGWVEMDRLINQLSGRTFSALIERSQSRILTHSEDKGLGGNTCFKISLEMEVDDAEAGPAYDDLRIPADGFTSDPRYIMALIDQVIHREATTVPPEFDYKMPIAVRVKKNNKTLFEMPLKTSSWSALPDKGFVDQQGRACHSVIEPQWREITWATEDVKLMKIIADTAPADCKKHIKGSYLVEAMGL
jgi:hypothetical protein